MRWMLVLIVLVGLVETPHDASGQATRKPPDKVKAPGAVPGYRKQTIHGFTLLVNNEVYQNNLDARWKRKPLEVLDLELGTIARKLPERTVKALRKLLVWIEWEDKTDPDLAKGVVAKYYGVSGNLTLWALGRGKHPRKANNIEVINMKSLTREHQPGARVDRCVLLHEMAHAVHHQVFGFDNPPIQAAYKQAMNRGLYREAKDVHGRIRRPPYAAKSEHEYFAELSCAYLDRLHYFPFTAEDLRKHDPVGYKVMEQTWGTRRSIEAALRLEQERVASRKLDHAKGLYLTGKRKAGLTGLADVVATHPRTKAASSARDLLEKWKPTTE